MGAWLSTVSGISFRIFKAATDEKGTQTAVAFTDRLSDYGDTVVGSTEAFDHVCDIGCEKEAVGFCRQCGQYYCFKCCQSHEKVTFSKSHSIVGKSNFAEIPDADKLFVRKIAPVSVETIPVDLDFFNTGWLGTCSLRCLAFSTVSKVLIALSRGMWLKIKDNHGRNISTRIEATHTILCLSSTNEILFTMPFQQQVQKCNINKIPIETVKHFKTSGDCWGIAEFDNGFAVSVKLVTGYSLPDWQVQYLDPKGQIKKQIYYDNQNNPLFSMPEYLASNLTQDTLYVSDKGKQAVIALDVLGHVLFIFSHSELKNPMALTVDDEDSVYVACGESVIQIHKSGTKHRVLLQKNKNSPQILSVCFNPVSRALVVGENSNKIKTFHFLPCKKYE